MMYCYHYLKLKKSTGNPALVVLGIEVYLVLLSDSLILSSLVDNISKSSIFS